MSIYRLLRRLLFQFDAEAIHQTVHSLLSSASQSGAACWAIRRCIPALSADEKALLRCRRWGLDFAGPVGLAAGFDKDGLAVRALAALGFHFVEVGTVTPRPQAGNPRPRLFREPENEALINRMGFNNAGVQAMARTLQTAESRQARIPIGINLGKNRDTPATEAASDYLTALRDLYAVGDYFVVNVSSPNTPGLRDLQEGSFLAELLQLLQEAILDLVRAGEQPKPLLLKIAPDLARPQLEAVLQAALTSNLAGLIVANTWPHPAGGLSGRPLLEHGHYLTAAIYRHVGDQLPLIGVGGLFTGADAYARIRAGASLVQCYTGFIYSGPATAARMSKQLAHLLRQDGFSNIDEAVGVDAFQLPDPWERQKADPHAALLTH